MPKIASRMQRLIEGKPNKEAFLKQNAAFEAQLKTVVGEMQKLIGLSSSPDPFANGFARDVSVGQFEGWEDATATLKGMSTTLRSMVPALAAARKSVEAEEKQGDAKQALVDSVKAALEAVMAKFDVKWKVVGPDPAKPGKYDDRSRGELKATFKTLADAEKAKEAIQAVLKGKAGHSNMVNPKTFALEITYSISLRDL